MASVHAGRARVVRLGDVARMSSGGTPPATVSRYYGGGIPWVSIADMTKAGKFVERTQRTLSEQGLAASAGRVYPAGVVLYAMYASLGECSIALGEVSSSQAILGIEVGADLDRDYLYYYLLSIKSAVKSLGQQGTQANLNASIVRNLKLWLPNLDEQRRVAGVLTDVDELGSSLEHLITKKQAIKQGMMQQLLTGKTRLPGFVLPWSDARLGELGVFLRGKGIKRDDVRRKGVPCIRYGEIYTTFGDYTSSPVSFVERAVADEALPICAGDLLFAGSGETREEIGKCVAFTGAGAAVAGGDLVVLRGTTFNPVYLASLTNTPAVAAEKAKRGQGDAVVHVSARALGDIVMNLPPREEQDAIATVLIDANDEIGVLRARLAKARALKQGMMQELLTGHTHLPIEERTS